MSPERIEYFSKLIVKRVAEGITFRDDLKKECIMAGMTDNERSGVFHSWGGLLMLLCQRGFLNYKVQEKKEFILCPSYIPMQKEAAQIEQARRYFTNFAPATIKDASYYFKWTQAYTKKIMKNLPLLNLQINGKDYFHLSKIRSNYPDIPHCIFLAGFDQLMLGYQKTESIYLPKEYLRGIYTLTGIIQTAILLDGKVIGKWKKDKTRLVIVLFQSVSSQGKMCIANESELLWDDIKKIEWVR
jgi:hypothetical protein